ncbi:MAG: biotin/lipoyl-containing protein [Paludibacteraceae bacterium]|nr:biotin/lipoyl-containing protein [Paludibacteraceae bacterium]
MKKFKFTIAGQPYDTTVNEIEPNVCEVTVNGTVFQVEIEKQETVKKKPVVAPRPAATATGAAVSASKPAAAAPASAGTTVVKSPLPGSIVKVMVQVGQDIKKGDTLLTMESMKMENVIASEVTGKVKSVLVQPGQNVMQDDKLVEIEVTDAAAPAPAAETPKASPAPAAPKAEPAPAPAPKAAPAGGTKITSPLPGSVIKVLVSEGQAVKKGDTLLTLESMKMENAIMAECDGTVSRIAVTAGQNVMQDDLLIVIA